MRRLLAAITLACALSVSVLAGDIPSLGAPTPPPQGIESESSPGQIPTVGTADQLSTDALLILLSVLGF